ncbi:MAG: NAD(P)-dependent oxidoreductase [Kiritimatiellaeota bacterium]|nr:NAD(P)-dependent oxidoreductase [Kiritimatiellota bacterium]
MKVLCIGGTGHIGRFLTPMLVRQGHDVAVMTRGKTLPGDTPEWGSVEMIRATYARNSREWVQPVASRRSEVVIDILGADVTTLYQSVKNDCRHLVCCGSVWMFGEPRTVPTPEEYQNPCVSEGYRLRYAELREIQATAAQEGLAFTAIMPPNICGPGKIPLETKGGRDPEVHKSLMRGEEVVLPYPGGNLIGPCDAEDIARAFVSAVNNRDRASGEFFNVGSAYALTAKQFVETYAAIYGREIPIRWVGYEEFVRNVVPSVGGHYHFTANMCPSIAKIKKKLGYAPNYTPEETLARAVEWMRQSGLL